MNLNDSKTKRWDEDRKFVFERNYWRIQKRNSKFESWEEVYKENEGWDTLESNMRFSPKILIRSSWWKSQLNLRD